MALHRCLRAQTIPSRPSPRRHSPRRLNTRRSTTPTSAPTAKVPIHVPTPTPTTNRALAWVHVQLGHPGRLLAAPTATLLDPLTCARVLQDWHFDPIGVRQDDLVAIAVRLFKGVHADVVLKVSDIELQQLVRHVAHRYHPTPYHSFGRGVMVMQAAYLLLTTVRVRGCGGIGVRVDLVSPT